MLVPVTFRWAALSALPPRARMAAAMAAAKAQYAAYFANPCLPQLLARQMALAPMRALPAAAHAPYAATITNLGVVDGDLKPVWPAQDAAGAPVFRTERLWFGHRLTRPIP